VSVPWVIGVDGGGSRGRAVAAPASTAAPPSPVTLDRSCNPYGVGAEAAADAVMAVIEQAWTASGGPTGGLVDAYVTLGLAGVDRPAEHDAITAALAARGLSRDRLEVLADTWVALEGAVPTTSVGPGARVLLIAGTGSVAVAADGARRLRVGGWGSRVGDEGSGAWLGVEAIRCTLRALDGRDVPGPLAKAVQARLGRGADALVGAARSATPADFARLAPLVLEHAADDPAAAALRARAVHHLTELVTTVAAKAVKAPAALACSGGVARALEPEVLAALPRPLAAVARAPAGPPVAGAWVLAAERARGA
jgi:glucosamine kinase